jgi:hypothetical protein
LNFQVANQDKPNTNPEHQDGLGPGLSKKYTSQLSDRGAKMKWQLGLE